MESGNSVPHSLDSSRPHSCFTLVFGRLKIHISVLTPQHRQLQFDMLPSSLMMMMMMLEIFGICLMKLKNKRTKDKN